jgi:hypothetical protein
MNKIKHVVSVPKESAFQMAIKKQFCASVEFHLFSLTPHRFVATEKGEMPGGGPPGAPRALLETQSSLLAPSLLGVVGVRLLSM